MNGYSALLVPKMKNKMLNVCCVLRAELTRGVLHGVKISRFLARYGPLLFVDSFFFCSGMHACTCTITVMSRVWPFQNGHYSRLCPRILSHNATKDEAYFYFLLFVGYQS